MCGILQTNKFRSEIFVEINYIQISVQNSFYEEARVYFEEKDYKKRRNFRDFF
jgi:hypothetical protein